MLRLLGAGFLLVAMASSASAALYTCTVQEQGGRTGWVPQNVTIAFTDDGGILVSDTIGLAVMGEPQPGELLNESSSIIAIKWNVVSARSSSNQNARFSYTATIDKAKRTLRLRAKPLGYANSFRGVGRCAVTEIPS
ncbi:MAG: hypothetical protein AAF871_02275 [Pseudomonadota bacterium]